MWCQDILKGIHDPNLPLKLQKVEEMSNFEPNPVKDPSLREMLVSTDEMKSKTELEDILTFEGKDLCIFVYSSEMENDFQQNVVKNYQRLATYFMKQNIKSVRFISYDLNLNGPSRKIKFDVPSMYFSPAFKRD